MILLIGVQIMNMDDVIKENYRAGDPIFISDIRELYGDEKSDIALRKQIERLADSGLILRVDRGIYTIKGNSLLGAQKQVDFDAVINRKFITYNDEIFGFYTGITLLNKLGISYQVPNIKEIITNNESTRKREVTVLGRSIIVRKSRTPINNENAAVLQFLSVVDIYKKYSDIPLEKSKKILVKHFRDQGVSSKQITEYIACFPSKVGKILLEDRLYVEFN